MRHRKKTRKLGVNSAHRRALLKNLFTSLLAHGKIKTTEVRGKELVSFGNSLIEKAKKGDLASRRKVSSHITNKEVSINFFKDTLPKVASRRGGHLRLLRIGARKGDNASMVLVELIKDESGQTSRETKHEGRKKKE